LFRTLLTADKAERPWFGLDTFLIPTYFLKSALYRLHFGPTYHEEPLSFTYSFSIREFPCFLCRRIYRYFSFSASTRSESLTLVQWRIWFRYCSLKNGTAVVRRQARSDLVRSYIGILKHYYERYRACACAAVRHHPLSCASSQLRPLSLVILIKLQP
jgi:hypothetical protein